MRVENGRITIAGISLAELAEIYGTPLYVYDAERIRENFRRVRDTARSICDDFDFYYAIKACNNLAVAELLVNEGAGIDAASVHEIKLARALGVAGERIMFSGNYLSDEDLREGLDSGAVMNLDDETLLPRLLRYGTPEILSFRVNPGYGESNVGEFVTNAGERAKFGIHPDRVVDAYREAARAGIRRFGVHMMPGSCVLEPSYFHKITGLLLDIVMETIRETRIQFEFIDLGGGLGIPYENGEKEIDLRATFQGMVDIVRERCESAGIPLPRLLMEPARYFVGDAGYVLGRVHTIKEGYGTIAGTDISMNVLARPAMYGAYHKIFIDGKENDSRRTMGLCGQVCENTDFWCRDRELPETLAVGDLVLVRDAGAYGFVMSYEYNGRLRPAEVLIDGGSHKLVRRRETFGDMVSRMIPSSDVAERLKDLI